MTDGELNGHDWETYFKFGESIISLLCKILYVLHPLGKLGASHVKEGPWTTVGVGAIELIESSLVLFKAVQRSVDIGVDSHDQTGVNLNLL